MAQYKEGWVTVPANQTRSGKAERRWRQPSGTLMEVKPGPGFVATQLGRAIGQLSGLGASAEAALNQAGGYRVKRETGSGLNDGMTGGNWPAGVPEPGTPVDPKTWAREAPPVPVLSDDADARASEARRMLQQATPYWEREENQGIRTAAAIGGGPRAGESGYAQRADIQAWMEANKNAPKGADGKNIVDRFLEQQQKRGLLDAPAQGNPAFGGERIAMPSDAESAVQAGTRGLVGFEGNALQQAQANVAELQGRERAALTQQIFQAAAQNRLPDLGMDMQIPKNVDLAFSRTAGTSGAAAFSGLEIAQPFISPEVNRQFAALSQPAAVQAVATGTGSGTNLQPASAAASEAGVEPAQPDAPGNKPNPADDLARRYIDNLRTTRAARLGA